MRRQLSMRRLLVVTRVAVIGAGSAITAALSYRDSLIETDELFDAKLAHSARVLKALSERELREQAAQSAAPKVVAVWSGQGEGGEEGEALATEAGHAYETKLAFQVWSGEGRLLLRSDNAPERPLGPLADGFARASVGETFETADGVLALAVGNDAQFAKLATVLERPGLASDPRFATNPGRVEHRDALVQELCALFRGQPTERWIEQLVRVGVPAGPVRGVAEAFEDPQAIARGMRVELPSEVAGSGRVSLIGSPLKLSETPVSYRRAPPDVGADGRDVLVDWLGDDGGGLPGLEPAARAGEVRS